MKEKLQGILQTAKEQLAAAKDSRALDEARVKFLGKKGELTALLKGMKDVAAEERPVVGQLINDVRAEIETIIDKQKKLIEQAALEKKLEAETIDVTLPGEDVVIGKKHPLNIVLDELVYVGTEERMLIFHRAEPAAPLKSRMSLRTLEEKLAEEGFLRIHNSFLVNMSYIAALQTSGVTLTTGQVLPVSLQGYKAIKMKYMAWRGRG